MHLFTLRQKVLISNGTIIDEAAQASFLKRTSFNRDIIVPSIRDNFQIIAEVKAGGKIAVVNEAIRKGENYEF